MKRAAFTVLAAVLVTALVALPGAGTLVGVMPVVVSTLPRELGPIGIVRDAPDGQVQSLDLRATTSPRAPPSTRTSTT